MRKQELIKRISELVTEQGGNGTMKNATTYVDAFIDVVKDAMANREEVTLAGFLKFYVQEVEAHKARNPKTGEEVDVPAKGKVKVKVLSALKQSAE